jgi:TPR repeat protein
MAQLELRCFRPGCITTANIQACSACHSILYCSTSCQTLDWPIHHSVCADAVARQNEIRRKQKSGRQQLADKAFVSGVCYENGWGVEQDYSAAAIAFRRAAAEGHVAAKCGLGWCLAFSGTGGVGDDDPEGVDDAAVAEGLTSLHEAATAGCAEAQLLLGLAHTGDGYCGRVSQLPAGKSKADLDEAFKWLERAASAGRTRAAALLRALRERRSPKAH